MTYPHELGARAACHGSDPDAWFPEMQGGFRVENVQAMKICHTCEVRVECLEWALHHERFGIWGGTTSTQRNEIRAKRNILVEERWVNAS
jgi:WhiB family redox-sensing transcriptional regulator